jgi:hypothetical protein
MKFIVVACIIPTKIYISFFKSHPQNSSEIVQCPFKELSDVGVFGDVR